MAGIVVRRSGRIGAAVALIVVLLLLVIAATATLSKKSASPSSSSIERWRERFGPCIWSPQLSSKRRSGATISEDYARCACDPEGSCALQNRNPACCMCAVMPSTCTPPGDTRSTCGGCCGVPELLGR